MPTEKMRRFPLSTSQTTTTDHHPALAHQFDSMEQQQEASTFGMWVFLLTEIMMFGGLFTAYLIYRLKYYPAFVAGSTSISVSWGFANTLVLIASRFTMAMPVWAAQKGYRLILVIPDKMSQEKVLHLRALGADIRITRSDVGKGHPDYYQDVAERLAREMGIDDLEQHLKFEIVYQPKVWQERFNLEKGAAFGLSHNFAQVGYLRPQNRHSQYKNLYFAGASTHPGTGLPIVLLSAKLTVQRILEEMETATVPEQAHPLQTAAVRPDPYDS